VFADDPVSGLAFVLDPASKSADKVHRSREFLDQPNGEDDGALIRKTLVVPFPTTNNLDIFLEFLSSLRKNQILSTSLLLNDTTKDQRTARN